MEHSQENFTKYLGKGLWKIAEIADELAEIGDIKTARTDAERDRDVARGTKADAIAERDEVFEQLAEAEDSLTVARKAEKDVLTVARAEATRTRRDAEGEGVRIIAIAREKVEALKMTLDQLEQDHAGVVKRYAEETEAARSRKDSLLAELAAVEKRIRG